MMPGLGAKKQDRIRRSREFQEIYARGHRLSGPHLTIFFKPNRLQVSRLGLSTSKRRFKLSTRRHYIQRLLREIYRLNKRRFRPGHDLVVSARRFEKDKTRFADIKNELLSLAQKAGLLKAGH